MALKEMVKLIKTKWQDNSFPRKTGVPLFYLTFALLVIMFAVGRFVLINRISGAQLVIRTLFIDLSMAVCIALLVKLLHAIHITASAAALLFVSIFHIANMELAAALDTFINIADLRYAMNGHFLKGSLHLSFPWYALSLFISAIIYLVAMSRMEKNGPIKVKYLLLCISISIVGVHSLSAGSEDWNSSNLLWLSVTRSIPGLITAGGYSPSSTAGARIERQKQSAINSEGEPFLRKAPGDQRNVLFVVLEGIPGVYLRQVQEWTGVKYPIQMPALSRIAEESVVIPNFVSHNRQTIRGLYSLLSGDYSKLSLTTPKIYEYMQLSPEARNPCLPEILANEGYATAYLQAAELSYMSKDQFMPAAGFQLVLGKEYFQYQYVPFGWGPDDRAFFEQAAEFIEDLDERSNPWFITLLTVGTHHPGAVPDKFAGQFSSRKEAAVAYLDQALHDFIERLRKKGILDDTLLLLTSDESHGVTGQPYGRFWGLAVAHAPESSGTINPGVFGLIDIPYSVLDYLGLSEQNRSFPRRSVFREYETERPILFESYFSEGKGVVKKRLDSSRVQIMQSSNGELFSKSYITETVGGDEGRRLSQLLKDFQSAADSSLYDSERKERQYFLLEKAEFIIGAKESKVLSTGQYLDIPAGTTVTVELEAAVELDSGERQHGNSDSLRLVLQMREESKKMPIPEIPIPVLKDRDSLRLSFSFYARNSLTRVWAYLQAESVNPSCTAKLSVERFSVETKERELKNDFQINRFLVNSGHSFQRPDAAHAGVWVDEKAAAINFSPARLDSRYDRYNICIRLRAKELAITLNGQPAAFIQFDHSNGEKQIIASVSRKRLKEHELNTISIGADNSGFELIHFSLRPAPPPVAHAGGGYRGLTYTNSIEALDSNARKFLYFEIDLEWTKDKQLIGLHDWEEIFHGYFGFPVKEPLGYQAFRKLRTADGFTPVDFHSIKKFLRSNPEARIVTDVKSDNLDALRKIAEFFPDFAERFIPQIYQPDELEKALAIGYKDIIWTLYRYRNWSDPEDILSHIRHWESEYNLKLFALAMPAQAIEKDIAGVLAEAGIPIYAHTVNSCADYARLLELGASSVYTDFLDAYACYADSDT